MEQELRKQMATIAAAYAEATGVHRASAARQALKDPGFFQRMERGDGFTARTFDKLIKWFHDHWPAQTEWPRDVARPSDPK